MGKLTGNDLELFRKAASQIGVVEARSGKFQAGDMAFGANKIDAGVIHCFNAKGEEVCLWYSGVSKAYRKFTPPRSWTPSHKRGTSVVANKEDLK